VRLGGGGHRGLSCALAGAALRRARRSVARN